MMNKGGSSLQLLHVLVVLLLLLSMQPAALGFSSGVGNGNMIRCLERERQALLLFKQGLVDGYGRLSSWGSEEDKNDCCKWRGVRCHNQTGHVIRLDLRAPPSFRGIDSDQPLRGNISSSLLELQHLNYLDLSYNDFEFRPIPKFIGSLTKLKYLNLSYASFGGTIPPQIGNLSNLRYLDLRYLYSINVENLEWLSHLSSLKYLDMCFVDLSKVNHWVDKIKGLPSLTDLYLSHCDLFRVMSPSISSINSSKSIVTLDLSWNSLTSSIYRWLFQLVSSSLVDLRLGINQLKDPFPDAFANFTSLAHLDLSQNQLEGVIPKSLGNLCYLQTLDLRWNNFSGNLDFLHNLSRCAEVKLQTLDLGWNQLTGSLPDFTRFSSMRELYLFKNRFNGFLPKSVGQLSTLVALYLEENQLSGPLPDFTGCSSLIELNLAHNQLNGSLIESIGQLSKLEFMDVSFNSLEDVISEVHLSNLTKLNYLDLSFNSLGFELSSEWVSPFQLDTLLVVSCKLGPYFPKWIQAQRNFSHLDISSNGIADTIPMWFWDLSPRLLRLNLSSNQISGTLPDLSSKFALYPGLDLSSNHFEGPIPLFPPNTTSLNLSKNKFSGTVSPLCAITGGALRYLDLSDNLLSGGLSDCWMHWKELAILNLADNKFSGEIPNFIGSLFQLETLVLHNNSFSGELPLSLRNCTMLRFLDLGVNKFSGKIPAWIGENLSGLNVLILRSNGFNGSIPLYFCHLKYLHLLDISRNNISGTIPQCFDNFTAMAQKGISSDDAHDYFTSYATKDGSGGLGYGGEYIDNALVGWKGMELEYGRYLGLVKSIDLSTNKLTGEVPEEITSLLELVALNLSANKFYGMVPQQIGQLKSLESLDLSRNQFSGEIPTSMSELSFLSYLDLSYNDLSGKIPSSTQLQSFNASRYVGNGGLCGPPLTPKCPGDEASQGPPTIGGNEDDGDEFGRWFYIGSAVGFTIGFWGACGALLLKRSWRHAYFIFLDNLKDWLYVTMAMHMAKLQRKFLR